MPRAEFLRELEIGLADGHAWYGDSVPVRLVALEEIVSLDGAHYVDPDHGSAVWLGMVETAV